MDTSARRQNDQSPTSRVGVACPQCKQHYKVASTLLGRRLICKKCHHTWRAKEVSPKKVRTRSIDRNEPPSDSGRVSLFDDLPPEAGSSSIAIDMSWAGRQIGRYRARSLLGHGGMGVVWRAHDDTLRRDVALKILNRRSDQPHKGGLNVDLFRQEARAVAKLQHPSVVSIYEVAEDQGHLFLSLELMEGGTLKEYVDRNGTIKPLELFSMMLGPARALALAHRRGIVHRDIKPGNLMFDEHGHLKLMDFGLADVSHEVVSEKLRGRAVGSLGWVAPETVRGEGSTPLSDIYSFGLVLLYAMTGKPLIHAKSRVDILKLHRHPPQPNLKEIKGLSSRGGRLLSRCLAVKMEDRFISADVLVEALQVCADEDPIARKERRRAGISIAAAASIMGAIIGIGGAFYFLLNIQQKIDEFQQPMADDRLNRAVMDQADPRQSQGLTDAAAVSPVVTRPSSDQSGASKLRVPWPEVFDAKDLIIVASQHGKVFHLATSSCGRQIYASNLVKYDSIEEAVKDGRKPCRECHPDLHSQELSNLALSHDDQE